MTVLEFELSPPKEQSAEVYSIEDGCLSELLDISKHAEHNLIHVLDTLTRVVSLLRPETHSEILQKAYVSLVNFHASGTIWTVEMTQTQTHIWNRLLQLYFSIPDRLASVLDSTISPVEFIRSLVNNDGFRVAKEQRVVDIVQKSAGIGGIQAFAEAMLRNKQYELVKYCLDQLSLPSLDSFVSELCNSLSVGCADPLSLVTLVEKVLATNVSPSILRLIPDIPFDVLSTHLYFLDSDQIGQFAKHLLELWAVRTDLLRSPLHWQRKVTKLTLVALSYCSYNLLSVNSLEGFILDGVQKRLNSSDEDVALLGKVVAECFATLTSTETKLTFELDASSVQDLRYSFEYARILGDLLLNGLPCVKAELDWSFEQKPIPVVDDYELIEPSVQGIPALVLEKDAKPIMKITEADEEPRNAKIKKPRFVRECLAYLKCPDDPAKLELGITQLGKCLKESSTLLLEEIGADLFRAILFQMDHFDIPNFDEMRKASLCELLQRAPQVVGPVIIKELAGRSCSLRQKLETVICCMLAIKSRPAERDREPITELRMKLLSTELGLSDTAVSASLNPASVIRNAILPLFSAIPPLLLEKVILLLALAATTMSSLPDYSQYVKKVLNFMRPLFQARQPLERPILRTCLIALQCVLSGIPEGISILEYIEDVVIIGKFLEDNEQLSELDPGYIAMAGYVATFLQERADPVRLLQEAASEMSFERELDVTIKPDPGVETAVKKAKVKADPGVETVVKKTKVKADPGASEFETAVKRAKVKPDPGAEFTAIVKEKLGEETKTKKSKKTKDDPDASPDAEEYRWWEEQDNDGSVKWTTLEHHGLYFPPLYEPHGVKMLYNGKPIELEPEAEEVSSFFAAIIGTDHYDNEIFRKNFFEDFCAVLHSINSKYRNVITEFEKCDFGPIAEHLAMLREKKKMMGKEEKELLKKEKSKIDEHYGFCTLDGRKEKVGNFRVEPPGLFRGRGKHPKAGKLKTRVPPESITINVGEGCRVPPPPEGHSWGKVVHDNTVTWLANWTENINKAQKYVYLAAGSSLKGQSDLRKFEVARNLNKHVEKIRRGNAEELRSKEMFVRQRATALWLIDHLALRAGNEKGEDEADTVGCCSLRCEHVRLEEPNFVIFDFLGKDSIRYYNRVPVDAIIFKNLGIFMRPPKTKDDPIFDRLNTGMLNKYLNTLMPGLTAKVFRTYNASHTFQEELKKTPQEGTVHELVLAYNRANREVAVLCNHQRAVPKTHQQSMQKLSDKILTMKYQRHLIRGEMKEEVSTKELRSECPQALGEESDMDEETIVQKAKEADDLERSKMDEGKSPKSKKRAGKETLIKRFVALTARIEAAKNQRIDRDENKTTSLGTSKTNYIDPRITAAWCEKHKVPIEKMFNKSLREKFKWAMTVPHDWQF
ncbi:hypothetical protein PSACC_02504 [Paramicrosporidium saccamoebae]|uniref:DNA topoisomerase I n=1 Tax=Paramicrosporidium saccamoebae TaxID=1246581 RepID=A0A2H9TIV8_9FUNG|nr:hypothetical protein PSACC_02504 [Paramicrosporidium saccamoebae]